MTGPCGESFKQSFSCFMRSTEEVKGVDCVEQFEGFQKCLQSNPEHAAEIMGTDESEDEA